MSVVAKVDLPGGGRDYSGALTISRLRAGKGCVGPDLVVDESELAGSLYMTLELAQDLTAALTGLVDTGDAG